MSNQELIYEDYNKRSFAVRGDREKFTAVLKQADGRWNPRMKNGPGWLVPKEKLPELKKIIEQIKSTAGESNQTPPTIQIKSRKNHRK